MWCRSSTLANWCRRMESNHRRARLQRAALPLSYFGENGAGGGNRNRVFGVALRGLTFQLHPHGGKRRESNLLPQRDCGYGAATAPAVLMGASRNLILGLLCPPWPSGLRRDSLRARVGLPSRSAARREGWRRAEGSNLCPRGPLGFRDRLPATPAALSESKCISQDSNLDPVRYERTALPIELEMRNWSARQDSNLRSPAPEAGALPG